ncbi:MAG TPA: DUF1614 domain-containing protein [Caulobacteraceae bacterium]|nr:DUF1614 domain-containing protein [Caulobacteraceae bacterium]
MPLGHVHYLPVGLPLFALLAGLVALLILLVQLRVLHSVYTSLGVSSGAALLLLVASLAGSYFNIPVAQLPDQHVAAAREIQVFGEVYVVPLVANWPGTVVAVNVGGAVIPVAMSLYLLLRHGFWLQAIVAVGLLAGLCHALARPVAGLGIALPGIVPGVAAALVAVVIAPRRPGPVAYVGGSLGVLIGADLTNLDKLEGMDAPVASIGGAGTFDGIFLAGVVAVVLASLWPWGEGWRAGRDGEAA